MEKFIHIIFTLYLVLCLVNGNKYDPHVFPKTGPFFEGWYMRIMDSDTLNSIGLLFGHVQPHGNKTTKHPLVLSSILTRENCSFSNNCVLASHNAALSPSDLSITIDGNPVTHEPDDASPSNFIWRMTSESARGLFHNTGSSTKFNFRFGNVSLKGEIGEPSPWGPRGEGPEGWLDKLPFLPLHWFVYSLHSPVRYYEYNDKTRGVTIRGVNGAAHLEKNWGNSFPKAWIWSQGHSFANNISFALSGGPIEVVKIPVTAFLFGYRNPSKSITLNFRPDDSLSAFSHAGCRGSVNITFRGLAHEVHMNVTAATSSFSDCLYGPDVDGFRKASVESYDAIAEILVFRRTPLSVELIDKQTIPKCALEFGGFFMCHPCRN